MEDSKYANMTQTELDRQPKTGHRARAVSSNARSEAATIPDTIPFLRLGLRFHPFVSPTLSAAIVELRVAACFRARDELISTHID